ncbi:MAG: DMT family transporter [Chloroflexota bacterium]
MSTIRAKPPRLMLPFALGIAVLAVSTASILIRLAQQDAPSITIAALRLALATVFLAPLAIGRHRKELHALGRREMWLAALSGTFLALHFGTWISSLEYTSVASSVVLVSTGPLWVALLAPLFLGERLTSGTMLGLALAVVGGIIIAAGDACRWEDGLRCTDPSGFAQRSSLWGNFLALAGAWAVSGYLILGRRLRATLALVPYIFLVYGFAALGLLVSAVLTGSLVLALPPVAYGWIVLLAIVPQLIGHSTYNWALRYLPAAFVAVTTLGEPVGSALLAYFVLDERPGAFVLGGAVFILGGIYLAARGTRRADGAAA